MIEVHKLVNKPVSSNCFVVLDKSVGNECIIVDPGSEDNRFLFDLLDFYQLFPKHIILTHEHFDHCWGVNSLMARHRGLKLICSSMCSNAIQDKKKNYSVFYEQPGFDLAPADIEITQSTSINLINHKVDFIIAQGHSASGLIFLIGKYVFTGDELIKEVKTVTKLKTGSKSKLQESINFLKTLKGKGLIVCPGHGEMFDLDKYEL